MGQEAGRAEGGDEVERGGGGEGKGGDEEDEKTGDAHTNKVSGYPSPRPEVKPLNMNNFVIITIVVAVVVVVIAMTIIIFTICR